MSLPISFEYQIDISSGLFQTPYLKERIHKNISHSKTKDDSDSLAPAWSPALLGCYVSFCTSSRILGRKHGPAQANHYTFAQSRLANNLRLYHLCIFSQGRGFNQPIYFRRELATITFSISFVPSYISTIFASL